MSAGTLNYGMGGASVTRMTLLRLAAAAPLLAAAAGPAQALGLTYVSAAVPGSSNCGTLANPCRDFENAINQTDPGGTIVVLTSGDYSGYYINKSLTITATGVDALVKYCTNGGAFAVELDPGEQVTLRGLTMDCKASNIYGLSFGAAGSLHVQDSLIRGYYGILVSPSSVGELHVTDTTIADSGYVGPQAPGLQISGRANIILDRVRFLDNNNAILMDGASQLVIRDSVISGTAQTGIAVVRTGSPVGRVLVEGTTVTNGQLGIRASGSGAVIRLSNSAVTGNRTGLAADGGGRIISFENNVLTGNFFRNGAPTGVEAHR